jgi:hypothetical protein
MVTRLAPKWHFVSGLPSCPSWSPEIPKVATPAILGAHNFVCRPLIKMSLKQNSSPCWELANGMSHATYTRGNRGHFRLLVVKSQLGNLTPDLSFGHNLCFKCPNGSCEPTLNIYVPRAFQGYNERLNPMRFDLYNRSLKHRKSIRNPSRFQLPKWELTWECGCSFSHTLQHSFEHEMWLPGFPLWFAPLQALALVTSPRLGLQQWSKL